MRSSSPSIAPLTMGVSASLTFSGCGADGVCFALINLDDPQRWAFPDSKVFASVDVRMKLARNIEVVDVVLNRDLYHYVEA